MINEMNAYLAARDPEVAAAIEAELTREQDGLELIASENIVSEAVMMAAGSVMTNKYAEGYPSKRYYGGCACVDGAENLAIERAKELLDTVGLSHRANSRLNQLSGGEQQRIAIAIALANRPKLLLADEPTGAVDSATASMVLDIFRDVCHKTGLTVVIVTHDNSLARRVDRVVAIRDGRTSSEFIRPKSYAQEINEVGGLEQMNRTADEQTAQVELAVVDASGRLQIPREHLSSIGISGKARVKVEMEDGKVVIINPEFDGNN